SSFIPLVKPYGHRRRRQQNLSESNGLRPKWYEGVGCPRADSLSTDKDCLYEDFRRVYTQKFKKPGAHGCASRTIVRYTNLVSGSGDVPTTWPTGLTRSTTGCC